MLNQYFRWVVDRPWLTLCLSLLFIGFAASGLQGFKASNDPRSFFSKDDPSYERFEDFEVKYGARDAVILAIHPPGGTVFTQRYLGLLEDITDSFWEMPHAVRVQSLTNFANTQIEGDFLETDFLVREGLKLTDDEVRNIREIALNEPTLVDSLVSDSGHVAAVVATVLLDDERTHATLVTEWSRKQQAYFEEKYPEIDFYLTGTVIFNDAMGQATREGFTTTLPISMLASVIALVLLLRSFLGMFISLIVINASVICAVGISVMTGIVFQPVSSYATVIVFTLAIADSVHILISHQQQLSLGNSKREALLESLRINYQPVFLTSITTAIGFICLNTSESPPLRDLGNITAIGVMAAFFLSLSLLPALVMIFPSPKVKQGEGAVHRIMDRFAEAIIVNRTRLLIGTAAVMLVLGVFVPQNKFNDVWHEYFDNSFDVRVAGDFIADNLTGFQRVDFSIPAKDAGGISEPEYLAAIEAFNQWAEQQPEVSFAGSYSDVIKRLNRNMNADDPAFFIVPADRALASQYLLMYEMSLPFGLGLDNQITMNKDETLFTIVMYQTSSAYVMEFADRAQDWLEQNFPGYMKVESTGLDKLFSEIGYRNSLSLLGGSFLAMVLISGMIMFALRSTRYGVLSLLPNLLPAFMAFGVWGLIDGNISLSVSIVACITLGIVVDDTVHFLSKYVRAKREQNLATEQAVRYAFRTVGVALVSTSIILVLNFGVMAFSSFQPASSLGLLTAITIVLALAVDFLFFAPLLLALDAKASQRVLPEEASIDAKKLESQGVAKEKLETINDPIV
ncbi:MAG: MMPL family transporter [Pseudomonadales bacterium]|nr:MMPL family transporter [Pseudomonadales bacterium]